jgi:cytoskeletal protein CcmA (bactofilin family)
MAFAALALILLFFTITLPAFALAGDTRSANEVIIGQGEIVSDDLYIAAGTVEFAGDARRDVNIAAGRVTLGGSIDGSVNLASGRADIDGTIDGSLRILSGRVEITGTIGGDVVVAGGQVELLSSGQVNGNLIVAGGTVDLRGRVNGDVTGYAGNVTLGGTFQGAVDVNTSNLEILNTARISGPVTYVSRQDADVDNSAQLTQGIERDEVDPWGNGSNPLGRASGSLLRTLWALIAGALIVLAAPRLANQLGSNGKRIVRSLVTGIIALVVVPIVAVVLMVTVIGIPAGVILLAMYFVALYLSQVFVGMAIGRMILPNGWNDGTRGFHLLAMTLGVLIIGALRFLPLPYVYSILAFVITIWGIGAALMLLGSLNRRELAQPA